MSTALLYYDYVPEADMPIIEEVREFCASLAEFDDWTPEDGAKVAEMLCKSDDPWGLFRFIDERTGLPCVGYKTRDGREWFYILRQMRNQVGSGLFENLPQRYS